jgi:uncharacterized protein YndB with AHSA1/START domain
VSTLPSQTAPDADGASVPDVRKHVAVPVPAARAFEIFAARPLGWWPADHKLVPGQRTRIEFEKTPGGRWYELDADGAVADWGRVLVWDPPRQIALSWRIDGRWRPIDDDEKASEIVVTFTPDGPDRAVVELAHVKLYRHGEWAASIHAALDGPSPGDTLAKFASLVDEVLAETPAA